MSFKLTSKFLAAAVLSGATLLSGVMPDAWAAEPPHSPLESPSFTPEQQEIRRQIQLFANVLKKAQDNAVVEHSYRDLTNAALQAIVKKTDSNAGFLNQGGEEKERLLSLDEQRNKNLMLAVRILQMAKHHETEKHSYAQLMETGLKAMLQSIDPHSDYFNARDWKALVEDGAGQFGGIGVQLDEEGGTVKAQKVMEGNPADKAGMKDGDVITHVDGKPVKELGGLLDVVNVLRGQVGEKVTVTVQRKGADTPITMTMARSVVEIKSVLPQIVRTEKGNIGLITISQYTEQTPRQFAEAVKQLKLHADGSPFAYIINERYNPGGSLGAVNEIGDMILRKGVVSFLVGRGGQSGNFFEAGDGDILDGRPLVLLTGAQCASACEILAGALKDNPGDNGRPRAVIMSSDPQTFGKGSAQTLISLPDGLGGMKVTNYYFSTPAGSPHKVGVKPHVLVVVSESNLPQPAIKPGTSPEEETEIRKKFKERLKMSEATLQNVLPEEKALLRKDAPPVATCRVAPDKEGVRYGVERADILLKDDVVDEVLTCAVEILTNVQERATFEFTRAPAPAPR
jgi:carboxyl-terminal processing protease